VYATTDGDTDGFLYALCNHTRVYPDGGVRPDRGVSVDRNSYGSE